MVSLARTLRIDARQADVWANLTDLESFARALPALTVTSVETHGLLSRLETRIGLWSIAGTLKVQVSERHAPNRLCVRGTLSLDDGSQPSQPPVRFDAVWHLESDEAGKTRATYMLRLRATPMLERLASMALSRRTGAVDRRVAFALSRPSVPCRAA